MIKLELEAAATFALLGKIVSSELEGQITNQLATWAKEAGDAAEAKSTWDWGIVGRR